MLVAAVVVEVVSRKRTLFTALFACGVCTAALIASEQSVFLWGSRGAIMGAFAVLFIYTPEVHCFFFLPLLLLLLLTGYVEQRSTSHGFRPLRWPRLYPRGAPFLVL